MKGDKRKLTIGPILVVLGMGLYNLLKGHKAIYILFITLIMLFIYELYILNKSKKAKLEENIILAIGVILMIIGILDQAFYDTFIKYHLNFFTVPIIIFTLILIIFVAIVVSAWKEGDKAKAKRLAILTLISVLCMLSMIVVII